MEGIITSLPYGAQILLNDVSFWVKNLWFLWLPVLLWEAFYGSWVYNARHNDLIKKQWVLLEIRIPRDILKSPRAVETILSSLYSPPKKLDPWWKWKGIKARYESKVPDWFSLEIAGINGGIHFFVRVPKDSRNFIEAQIYAQFSGAEISEASDYTYASDFDNLNDWNIWGAEFELAKEDAYPIRTYVDFGLHEAELKEEHKINPLVSFVEFLGTLKEGEQVWFQIMARSAKTDWTEEGKKEIDKLMGREGDDTKDEKKKLTKGENEIIAAIERNLGKTAFETTVRAVYVAKRDLFKKPNTAAVVGLMGQYNSPALNGFKPGRDVKAKFPFKDKKEVKKKKGMLKDYRKRAAFSPIYAHKSFVFNVEELATVFHFPGRVSETPSFERIEAKKGAAPANLPI